MLETVERDLRLFSDLGLTLEYTIETHIHADHVTGAGAASRRDRLQVRACPRKAAPSMSTSPFAKGADRGRRAGAAAALHAGPYRRSSRLFARQRRGRRACSPATR